MATLTVTISIGEDFAPDAVAGQTSQQTMVASVDATGLPISSDVQIQVDYTVAVAYYMAHTDEVGAITAYEFPIQRMPQSPATQDFTTVGDWPGFTVDIDPLDGSTPPTQVVVAASTPHTIVAARPAGSAGVYPAPTYDSLSQGALFYGDMNLDSTYPFRLYDGVSRNFSVDTAGNLNAHTVTWGSGVAALSSNDSIILPENVTYATPARVQGVTTTSATYTNTGAWPGATTAGNLLVMMATHVSTLPSITSGPAGWTQVAYVVGVNYAAVMYYKENCGAGEANPTITFDTGTISTESRIEEYSGILTAGSLDVSASLFTLRASADTTHISTGTTATTAQRTELWVGVVNPTLVSHTVVPPVISRGFSGIGTSSNHVVFADHVVNTIGTAEFNAKVDSGGDSYGPGIIATFKAKTTTLPAPAANTATLYAKDSGGVSKLFYKGDDDVEVGPLSGHEAAHIVHDTLWDAAGDLVVGTGADTAAKLAITVPAANILEVLGVVNGESTATWKAVHDGTAPVTQAYGDSATAGTALTAAHRDHKHGMPSSTLTRSFWLMGGGRQFFNDGATSVEAGTDPDGVNGSQLADATTEGIATTFAVPYDWSSGVMTYQIYWLPRTTDATPHTVQWSTDVYEIVPGGAAATTTGTTTAWTGGSAARTLSVLVTESAQTLLTPTTIGNVVRMDIRRLGADVADTYVGNVLVIGVLIVYTANR